LVGLSVLLGLGAGAAGAFFSYAGRGLPTGPLMVLAAAAVFFGALALAPRHGLLARFWRRRSVAARMGRENTLKAVYHVLEEGGFQSAAVSVADVASRRGESAAAVEGEFSALHRAGLGTMAGGRLALTPAGWQRACEIVRNHRLWELYLTNAASLAPDHVHEDAEKIEHILGEETVRHLEKRLNYAQLDPHGKSIPGLRDMMPGGLNPAKGGAP
jgi:manganese/zinc/iron transport system permease protein